MIAGGKEVKSAMFGTEKLSRIYLGETQLWNNATEEYIEGLELSTDGRCIQVKGAQKYLAQGYCVHLFRDSLFNSHYRINEGKQDFVHRHHSTLRIWRSFGDRNDVSIDDNNNLTIWTYELGYSNDMNELLHISDHIVNKTKGIRYVYGASRIFRELNSDVPMIFHAAIAMGPPKNNHDASTPEMMQTQLYPFKIISIPGTYNSYVSI